MKDLGLAGQLITAPTTAFTELRERPRFLFPLVILSLASAFLMYWYFSSVDFAWYKDSLFEMSSRLREMNEAQRASMMSRMSLGPIMVSSIIGALVMVPLMSLLMAVYYLIAGKITNVQLSFKHWFSLAAWTAFPGLIALVASFVAMAVQGDHLQLNQYDIQVLSLNQLIFQRHMGEPGYMALSTLGPIQFWSWILSVVGIHTWSQRSWVFSATFALLPVVVIGGLMFYFTG